MPTRIDSFWIGKGGIEDWEGDEGNEGMRKGWEEEEEKGREEYSIRYNSICIIYNNSIT